MKGRFGNSTPTMSNPSYRLSEDVVSELVEIFKYPSKTNRPLRSEAYYDGLHASDVGPDFLAELAEAILNLLAREGTWTATINEEPTEFDWVLTRSQDVVVFSIFEFPGVRRVNDGKQLLELSCEVESIAVPVWRAMKELGLRTYNESFPAYHWTTCNGFPTERVAQPGRALGTPAELA